MVAVTRSGEPEQRLTAALRARATGAGRVDGGGRAPGRLGGSGDDERRIRIALLVALGIGLLVGVLFAVISLASPGTLPPLG
jgi:hypothetical protein